MVEICKLDRPAAAIRAALYCRVSTAGQEDNASLATQEEACRAYAAEHGWTVTATFREVHTGVDLFERPQLAQLRDAMRKREVDAIVCYSTDRLSRDPVHLGLVQYEATYYGIDLAFVTDTYDTSFEGQMLAMVRGIAGKIEYERIRERTKRGKKARLDKGFPNVGNKAPYGYHWNDERTMLRIEPLEAERVREAFNRIATGTSVNGLCREWNERGIPSPAGRTWVPPTLRDIIDKDLYFGRLVAQRTETYYEIVPGIGRVKKTRPCRGHRAPGCRSGDCQRGTGARGPAAEVPQQEALKAQHDHPVGCTFARRLRPLRAMRLEHACPAPDDQRRGANRLRLLQQVGWLSLPRHAGA